MAWNYGAMMDLLIWDEYKETLRLGTNYASCNDRDMPNLALKKGKNILEESQGSMCAKNPGGGFKQQNNCYVLTALEIIF